MSDRWKLKIEPVKNASRRARLFGRVKEIFTDLNLLAKFVLFCLVAWVFVEAGLWIHHSRTNEDGRQQVYADARALIRKGRKAFASVNKAAKHFEPIGQNLEDSTAKVPGVLGELQDGLAVIRDKADRIGNSVDAAALTLGTEIYNRSEDLGKTQAAVTETVNSVNTRLNSEEATAILCNLSESSNGLKVLVNDPHLKTMLESSLSLLASSVRSGQKVEVVLDKAVEIETTAEESNKKFSLFASDFQTFSHKYLNPGPPKGFWGKFKAYTLQILGYGRDGATVVRIYRDLTGRIR